MAYNSGNSNGHSSSFFGRESNLDADWSPDLDPDDLRELQAAQNDPSKLIAQLPKESVRMGYFSAVCLILNRMIGRLFFLLSANLKLIGSIGVGIFTSPSVVFLNTQSIGLSMILWMLGGIMTIAGGIVFVELGLTIPRWPLGNNGEKISAIRSGDGLNYVSIVQQDPFRHPLACVIC